MSLAPANPVEGLRPPDEGPQKPVKKTRPRARLWDRLKFLILFVIVFLILVWTAMANNPILPFVDAFRMETRETWGLALIVLFGIELLRQVHYLISELSAGYHHFWSETFFGGSERLAKRRMNDWTRFRIARVIKWVVALSVIFIALGAIMKTSPLLAAVQLPAIIWGALPLIIQVIFIMALAIMQFVAIFWFMSRGGVETYFPDDIKTRFADVWGQDHVLKKVQENIVFLEKPEEIESRGGYVPGGILLWGPPGTGKTLMAEAVAGETGKPYVFVDPGAFINMFFGVGILKVKSLFRKLRKMALRYGGVIVFFDEADSLGNRGVATAGQFPRTSVNRFANPGCHGFSYLTPDVQTMLLRDGHIDGVLPVGAGMNGGMGGMMGMGTLQALLTELSGLKKPRGFVNRVVRRTLGMRPKPPPKYRILVMMATNMPDALDEALLRPGRIDRIYKVGYPSKAGRIRTYEGYFAKVRHQLSADDMEKLATITPYATGATMKDLVNESLVTAIREGREVITWPDVVKAKHLKELGPPEDVEYIERERHAVAVHEACHAVVAFHQRKHFDIDIATIEKGSDYLGMVKSIPPEDQMNRWRSEFIADIYVSLASLAGERMFFEGDSSKGVSGDLESATWVATLMESMYGMGSTVSSVATAQQFQTGTPGGGMQQKPDPLQMGRARLADRIEDNLSALLEQTRQILEEHRREVLSLAHALEAHKTLSGEDVTAVLKGHRGPLVDGRPYQNDEFYRQIEAYHRAAVIAHLNHTAIKLALPVAPDYEDEGWSNRHGVVLPQPPSYGPPVQGAIPGNGAPVHPGYGQPPALPGPLPGQPPAAPPVPGAQAPVPPAQPGYGVPVPPTPPVPGYGVPPTSPAPGHAVPPTGYGPPPPAVPPAPGLGPEGAPGGAAAPYSADE